MFTLPEGLQENAMIKGRLRAEVATSLDQLQAAQDLRAVCFGLADRDVDSFDAQSQHILIRDLHDDKLLGCFRLRLCNGSCIETTYSAEHYDLTALANFRGNMIELGRFCIHPDAKDPDIIRLSWAVLTSFVDKNDVAFLFGCTSFPGVAAQEYAQAFALLKAQHMAPSMWKPKHKSQNIFEFSETIAGGIDLKQATAQLPPLLRTYLLMGGWVSDHAVIDPVLKTIHVFTGLEVKTVPETRKRLLRALV